MSGAYSDIFSGTRALNFDIFSRVFFSGGINLKQNEEQKRLWGGPGGMLSRRIFENLHTAMAILVLFEQIAGKFRLNFLPLIDFKSLTK